MGGVPRYHGSDRLKSRSVLMQAARTLIQAVRRDSFDSDKPRFAGCARLTKTTCFYQRVVMLCPWVDCTVRKPYLPVYFVGLTHQDVVRVDGFGDLRARPNLTHAGHGDPAEHSRDECKLRKS